MATAPRQHGFTLLEALVAMAIVALVVLSFLGIRTTALRDAGEARNWRLAREIAEEKLSELIAGARELQPESGASVSLDDDYPGFSFRIYVGESAVANLETDLQEAAGDDDQDEASRDRAQWQQNRDTLRRASERGVGYYDYQEQLAQEQLERERQEKAPSETDFEEVAVVVFFPKLDLSKSGDDAFVLKAKVSTLAISGRTPEQAQAIAESMGQTTTPTEQAPGTNSGNTANSGNAGNAGKSGG